MEIRIIAEDEQIIKLFSNALKAAEFPYSINAELLNKAELKQEEKDNCFIQGAEEELGLSKSKIYKLTSSKQIPHKKFGPKLVFSRKALRRWRDSQMRNPHEEAHKILIGNVTKSKQKGGVYK